MEMDLDRVTDEELARRATTGDASAFELLLRRHQEGVWRFALALLRSADDAEEATQEALIRAFRGLPTFRGESSFRTWVFAICRRACHEVAARTTNIVPLEEAHGLRYVEDSLEERRVIDDTLERMPRDERAAFVLVDVLGFSREEAASIERVPASTLKSRLYRARDRLAAALESAEDTNVMRGGRR